VFRTMLVEDNPSFRQILNDNLQDLFPSMEIIEAGDGVEAFQKIDFHPPDLIFMDVRLPGENGLELTRKIKADHPGIIVIILTSYESPEYREAAKRNKADRLKPAQINREIAAFRRERRLTYGKSKRGA
jgi:CheY-like chemotaxis protein